MRYQWGVNISVLLKKYPKLQAFQSHFLYFFSTNISNIDPCP